MNQSQLVDQITERVVKSLKQRDDWVVLRKLASKNDVKREMRELGLVERSDVERKMLGSWVEIDETARGVDPTEFPERTILVSSSAGLRFTQKRGRAHVRGNRAYMRGNEFAHVAL